MTEPEVGASETEEGHRAWLERLQRAAQRAHDELGDPEDPIVKALGADLALLVARLQRELEGTERGRSDAPGVT